MPSDHEILKEHGYAFSMPGMWLRPDGLALVSTEQALETIREDAEAGRRGRAP